MAIFSERKAKKGVEIASKDSDQENSDEEGLVVDENPSKSRKPNKQPKLKLKLSCKYCSIM